MKMAHKPTGHPILLVVIRTTEIIGVRNFSKALAFVLIHKSVLDDFSQLFYDGLTALKLMRRQIRIVDENEHFLVIIGPNKSRIIIIEVKFISQQVLHERQNSLRGKMH